MKYVLEAWWADRSPTRMAHREIIDSRRMKQLQGIRSLLKDGRLLMLSVRELMPGERIRESHGYSRVIRAAQEKVKCGGIASYTTPRARSSR